MSLEEEVKALRQEVAVLKRELDACRVDQATTSRLLSVVANQVVNLQIAAGYNPGEKEIAHLRHYSESLLGRGNDDLLDLVESIYWGHRVPKSE